MDLEAFELVLLRTPENAPDYDEAGRLAVEIMIWYCPPGTMSKPGRAVTV
jgi:hypothetical protein